jgi:hypothetical protein
MPKNKLMYLADSETNSCVELTSENKLTDPIFMINCSEYPNKNMRVNQEETMLLINDANKIKLRIIKQGKLLDT